MATKTAVRKLELFAIHAHVYDDEVDYVQLFNDLRSINSVKRRIIDRERAFAMPAARRRGDYVVIAVVDGPIGVSPTIFDLDRGTERGSVVSENEFVAETTNALVAPSARRIAIEYVRRGAKADDIAKFMESLLRREYPRWHDVKIEFAPVIGEDFLSRISQFGRIREADITVQRPNQSWTDHYTELNNLLEASGGDSANLAVRAGRGDTLSQKTGIIGVIRNIIRDAHPYLRKAAIRGVRRGEEAETTLSTQKHITHSVARVSVDESGRVSNSQIVDNLTALLAANQQESMEQS